MFIFCECVLFNYFVLVFFILFFSFPFDFVLVCFHYNNDAFNNANNSDNNTRIRFKRKIHFKDSDNSIINTF